MFVTSNQFYVFVACVAFGGVAGMFFSLSAAVKFFLKNKFLRAVPDVAAFTITFAVYLAYSFYAGFPDFRIYMFAGVAAGIALYMKSFHLLLAKSGKIIYNICERKKEKRNERRKVQKTDNGYNRGRGDADSFSSHDNGVSVDSHKRGKIKRKIANFRKN